MKTEKTEETIIIILCMSIFIFSISILTSFVMHRGLDERLDTAKGMIPNYNKESNEVDLVSYHYNGVDDVFEINQAVEEEVSNKAYKAYEENKSKLEWTHTMISILIILNLVLIIAHGDKYNLLALGIITISLFIISTSSDTYSSKINPIKYIVTNKSLSKGIIKVDEEEIDINMSLFREHELIGVPEYVRLNVYSGEENVRYYEKVNINGEVISYRHLTHDEEEEGIIIEGDLKHE